MVGMILTEAEMQVYLWNDDLFTKEMGLFGSHHVEQHEYSCCDLPGLNFKIDIFCLIR